ncbi:MAG: monovalent cation:proton antiporter family protein [Heyndrickxia sp.]
MHASLMSLVIVVVAAFLTPIILNRLRLKSVPVVVAEIIAGLIIGKTGLDLIQHGPWIDILSTLGFIFLMFLSGVEIDFTVFAGKGSQSRDGKKQPNNFTAASLIFLAVFFLSFIISFVLKLLHFTGNTFFMTLVISTISLGVVMPTLKEKNLMKTSIGQIILLITVIADLVTMVLLAVFVSFHDPAGGKTWLLLVLFLAGVILYFFGKVFRRLSFIEAISKGTFQIGTRAVFALIIVLVGISETVGAENILGAFLAGVLVSLLSPNKDMVQKLDSFGYGFLIPIFFVMVGVDLDLWKLFEDPKVFLLIPLLFIGLLISKMVPSLFLRKWFDWKTVIGSGFILTSTLSLVVAAAKVGERIHVMDARMSSALILLAVMTCLITPVAFNKIFPKHAEKKKTIAFLGANQLTLPLSLEMDDHRYHTAIYHMKMDKLETDSESHFDIIEVDNYEPSTLKDAGVFDANILVVSTGSEELNGDIAKAANNAGVERMICRIESPALFDELRSLGIEVFSSLFSTKTILKAMILTPGTVDLLMAEESGLDEVVMRNSHYAGIPLRRFPFLGDTIIVRIFRNGESIVPHGDTELQCGDRLVVTGSREHIDDLMERLSG